MVDPETILAVVGNIGTTCKAIANMIQTASYVDDTLELFAGRLAEFSRLLESFDCRLSRNVTEDERERLHSTLKEAETFLGAQFSVLDKSLKRGKLSRIVNGETMLQSLTLGSQYLDSWERTLQNYMLKYSLTVVCLTIWFSLSSNTSQNRSLDVTAPSSETKSTQNVRRINDMSDTQNASYLPTNYFPHIQVGFEALEISEDQTLDQTETEGLVKLAEESTYLDNHRDAETALINAIETMKEKNYRVQKINAAYGLLSLVYALQRKWDTVEATLEILASSKAYDTHASFAMHLYAKYHLANGRLQEADEWCRLALEWWRQIDIKRKTKMLIDVKEPLSMLYFLSLDLLSKIREAEGKSDRAQVWRDKLPPMFNGMLHI